MSTNRYPARLPLNVPLIALTGSHHPLHQFVLPRRIPLRRDSLPIVWRTIDSATSAISTFSIGLIAPRSASLNQLLREKHERYNRILAHRVTLLALKYQDPGEVV
jgi:hypothetical protein